MLVSQIVNRALRLLRVLDVASAPSAVESQTMIEALNAMAYRWEANGLALGWVDVSAPDDTLPAPAEAHEALAYQLALRTGGEFGTSLSPRDEALAEQFLADLRRDRLVEMPLELDCDLPSRGHWNIYTDEPV